MKKTLTYAILTATLFASCKKSEVETETSKPTNTYQIIAEASKIGWAGHMDSESNDGSFNVESDGITVSEGRVTGGSFIIPIVSINVLNLEGQLKTMLETHLKSADFFNLALHPTAKFVVKTVTAYNKTTEGVIPGANYVINGELTLLGKTKSLEFPARITLGGNLMSVLAVLKINRLDFGMSYASDPAIADHYIYPDVDVQIAITAKK